jgi:hypothetical protein
VVVEVRNLKVVVKERRVVGRGEDSIKLFKRVSFSGNVRREEANVEFLDFNFVTSSISFEVFEEAAEHFFVRRSQAEVISAFRALLEARDCACFNWVFKTRGGIEDFERFERYEETSGIWFMLLLLFL